MSNIAPSLSAADATSSSTGDETFRGVIALCDLEADADGGPFEVAREFFLKSEKDEQTSETGKKFLEVQMLPNNKGIFGPIGRHSTESTSGATSRRKTSFEIPSLIGQAPTNQWTRHIRPAPDIYEQNVTIVMSGHGRLRIKVMRPIAKGQELLAWFSNGIAVELGLPFLNGTNIKDMNSYKCHICAKVFRRPNPLKSHIFLHHPVADHLPKRDFSIFHDPIATGFPARDPYEFRPGVEQSDHLFRHHSCFPTVFRSPMISKSAKFGAFQLPEMYAHLSLHPGGSCFLPHQAVKHPQRHSLADLMGFYNRNNFAVTSSAIHHQQHQSAAAWFHHRPKNRRLCALPVADVVVVGGGGGGSNLGGRLPVNSRSRSYFDGCDPDVVQMQAKDKQLAVESMSTSEKRASVELDCVDDRSEPAQTSVSPGKFKEDSDDPPRILLVSKDGTKTRQGYMCPHCKRIYSRKYGLKIHVRTHTGYKPLKCKICQRPFGDPSNLNKHVRLHAEGDTPYRCDQCGKVLVRRRDLERHIRSRHFDNSAPGDSPLACEPSQQQIITSSADVPTVEEEEEEDEEEDEGDDDDDEEVFDK